MSDHSRLFQPFPLGPTTLGNRIVMAPMTRSRAEADGTANALMVEYYRQRAGAGLIVSEATSVSAEGAGYISIPGIYTQAQIDSWMPVTEAVHAEGGRIYLQLLHGGRIGHSSLTGGRPLVAPSALRAQGQIHTAQGMADFEMPEALTEQGIAQVIADFAQAARNAIAAGFDGVEIHGANGYLPNQFLAEATNHRTDAYGGSPENRARFVVELVEAVVAAVGAERTAIRLSPTGSNNGAVHTDPMATYGYLIPALNRFGLAYLHLMETFRPDEQPEHYPRQIAATFRPLYTGTLIASGGMTQEKAEALLQAGTADLIAFGSAFIANPDLPEKFRRSAPLTLPDRSTYYLGGSKGYIDYPALER